MVIYKEIRIDHMPIFFKHFFENGIVCVHDLLFDKDNSYSLSIISSKMIKENACSRAWFALDYARTKRTNT